MKAGRKHLKIGLLGPYGWGNLGDAAIQDAVIQNICRLWPDAEICGFSLNPADTEKRHGIKSYPLYRWYEPYRLKLDQEKGSSPASVSTVTSKSSAGTLSRIKEIAKTNPVSRPIFRFLKALVTPVRNSLDECRFLLKTFGILREFDILVMSGGGQIDDFWGGAWRQPLMLFKFSLLARLTQAGLVYLSVGTGSMDSAASRFLFKNALRLSQYRSFRDENSRDRLQAMGLGGDNPVYPDLAFSLDLDSYKLPDCNQSLNLIGINPIACYDPRAWPEKDVRRYERYIAELAVFCVELLKRGFRLSIFPSEINMDAPVIDDLLKAIRGKGVDPGAAGILRRPVNTVADLLMCLNECRIVVASRFHGVLLAQLLVKPVLALSYHLKVDTLMEIQGMEQYRLHLDEFDHEQLMSLFEDILKNENLVIGGLKRRLEQHQCGLAEQYVNAFRATGRFARTDGVRG